MKIIYLDGLEIGNDKTKELIIQKKDILFWALINKKNWNSPNLLIITKTGTFEQPTPLIMNSGEVIKFLKNHKKPQNEIPNG